MIAPIDGAAALMDLTSVSTDAIITFPNGLVGQPDWTRFVLLTPDDDTTLGVLQSVDNQQLSLLVTNPLQLLSDYSVELTRADRAQLGLESDEQPILLSTLSVHDQTITANLMGPLVINPRTHNGKQVVLADSSYTTRHPVAQVDGSEN